MAGVSCTNSVKSRPRIGSCATARASTVLLVAVSCLSSSGAAAVTVTVSVTFAIFRLTSSVSVAPTLRRTPVRCVAANAGADTSTTYVLTGIPDAT